MSFRLAPLVLLGALALGACGDDDANGPANEARLRILHLSPNAPAVNVLVGGNQVAGGVTYTQASSYLTVPAGATQIQVRAVGSTTDVINASPTLVAGTDYTVIASGVLASIQPLVLTDDNSAPAAGQARVRLVHGAPSVGAVDIYVTAPGASIAAIPPTVANVSFRQASSYLAVPAGAYQVRITPAGTKTVAIDVPSLTLAAGQVRTAIARDAQAGAAAAPLNALGVVLLADVN